MKLSLTRRAERVAIARLASARPIWAARTETAVPAVQRARLLQSILTHRTWPKRTFTSSRRRSGLRPLEGFLPVMMTSMVSDLDEFTKHGQVQTCVLGYCASWDNALLGPGSSPPKRVREQPVSQLSGGGRHPGRDLRGFKAASGLPLVRLTDGRLALSGPASGSVVEDGGRSRASRCAGRIVMSCRGLCNRLDSAKTPRTRGD